MVEIFVAIGVACRIPPRIPVSGEAELGELVDNRDVARGINLIELVSKAEAVVEDTDGEIERLGALRIGARQGHAKFGVPIRDHALLAPGLFPTLVHSVSARVRDAAGWIVAEAIEHQPQAGMRDDL